MKNNWIFATLLSLTITPFSAFGQVRVPSKSAQAAPKSSFVTGVQQNDAAMLADVLAVEPAVPLGPPDLLQAYEQAMTATAQGFGVEVRQIASAVEENKITEVEGEYLCNEAYQMAMMQFQAFSGLHDMLQQEMSQTAVPPQQPSAPAAAQGMSGSGHDESTGTPDFAGKRI